VGADELIIARFEDNIDGKRALRDCNERRVSKKCCDLGSLEAYRDMLRPVSHPLWSLALIGSLV
jgi:hypothetical protein